MNYEYMYTLDPKFRSVAANTYSFCDEGTPHSFPLSNELGTRPLYPHNAASARVYHAAISISDMFSRTKPHIRSRIQTCSNSFVNPSANGNILVTLLGGTHESPNNYIPFEILIKAAQQHFGVVGRTACSQGFSHPSSPESQKFSNFISNSFSKTVTFW